MRSVLSIFLLAVLGRMAVGCASGTSSGGSDAVAADSVAMVDSDTECEVMLPDTSYSSASVVKTDLQIPDTSVSGVLESIDDLYADAAGAFTFRKGSRRDASFGGKLAGDPSEIVVDWVYKSVEDYTPTRYGAWGGGTGWTGQPLYVEWPDSLISRFHANGQNDVARQEIIVGSLSGDVYFIDFQTGQPSRKPVETGNPIKGTVSLDPTLNGNLYVGQGLSAHTDVAALVVDLNTHKISHRFGPDPKAYRRWHAYDSSPVRVGQFLFRPGENGTLYKFIIRPGSLTLHSALRYMVGGAAPGMEASMAVYRNYGYTADNAGNIICFNLNTMLPVWHYKLPDDVDSTPVVVEESDGAYLYTGCEVEHGDLHQASFVKLDALTGEKIWLNKTEARRADVGEKHFDGGYYATCLPGSGNCSGLIFQNLVRNTDGQNGEFVAFDRSTGKIVYSTQLRYYAWSSPVGFLTPDGKQYVVTADCSGRVYLINGADGSIVASRSVGANFESSPVVVGNHLVVGSRGNSIYKLSLK